MKATFAFLANREVSNIVTKTAWNIHRRYATGVGTRRIPPHVSLKQPFMVADLDVLESFMEEFSRSILPFDIHIGGYQLFEYPLDNPVSGVLSHRIINPAYLHQLHTRLNEELALRFQNTSADFDGESYRFHLTVAMGGQSAGIYRQTYSDYASHPVDMHFQAQEMAMFVYDQGKNGEWEYLSYVIKQLGC